ncbi:hypothetical protein [Candidatus Palauibacter sp.]|uniref:hypothetical protein n=1 Tax=Candidatus Palauibacter sp. TaxID=3101350 RepID=UPI003AF2DCDC
MFVAGTVLASVLLGLLVAAVAALIPNGDVAITAVLLFVLVCVVAGVAATQLRLPYSTWVVPREWNQLPRGVHAFAFGAALGLGVATRIPFAAMHVVMATCLLVGSPQMALASFGAFGLVRAAPMILVSRGLATRGDSDIIAELDRLRRAAPWLSRLAVGLTGGLAGTLAKQLLAT